PTTTAYCSHLTRCRNSPPFPVSFILFNVQGRTGPAILTTAAGQQEPRGSASSLTSSGAGRSSNADLAIRETRATRGGPLPEAPSKPGSHCVLMPRCPKGG